MSVISASNLSHEDALHMGLCDFVVEELPVFIHGAKTTTGTRASWAAPFDPEASITSLWRETREARATEAGGDRRKLGKLYAQHMDTVAARIMSMPAGDRVEAARRWMELTGEPCPRGITLR
jgi:hypothetical protein